MLRKILYCRTVFLVSVSGPAPLHDVQGGVVEGDEGEAAGEAVLDKLLGGGGAGPEAAL